MRTISGIEWVNSVYCTLSQDEEKRLELNRDGLLPSHASLSDSEPSFLIHDFGQLQWLRLQPRMRHAGVYETIWLLSKKKSLSSSSFASMIAQSYFQDVVLRGVYAPDRCCILQPHKNRLTHGCVERWPALLETSCGVSSLPAPWCHGNNSNCNGIVLHICACGAIRNALGCVSPTLLVLKVTVQSNY